ncbi:MAG TPA: mechanosensitive ion channel domain-containing protein [Acetobacteraceae bacterium]|nr:mechanosensitive ion channel domain-containing protein [Acetobacteraceae bacterium]
MTSVVPRGGMANAPLVMLTLLAACLWLLHWSLSEHLVLGHGPLQLGLRGAAVLATAVLAVVVGGRAVLGLGLSAALGIEPTGLQRAIAYGLLTFCASAVVLASFGFDITAVLTTSAILTAVVGLAMQPTLGSLISGLALHMDRVLRVGDAVLVDGHLVEILRLDWRTAIGRRRDGALVVIPNSRITNETLLIHEAGRSIRSDTLFVAPAAVPPQRITELVTNLIADFPQVDASLAIMVMVEAQEPEHAAIRYRARYWVRQIYDRPEVASELLRRILYAFRREDIPLPASRLAAGALRLSAAGEVLPGGLEAAVALAVPALSAGNARRLAAHGRLLFYAPDERLVLPACCAGHALLLVEGRVRLEAGSSGLLAAAGTVPLLSVQRLGRTALLRQTADALARYIGPYAGHAVHRAASTAADLGELRQEVAREIEDRAERARFMEELGEEEPKLEPGSVLRCSRDATGRLAAYPAVRAAAEVAVLAVPGQLAMLLPDHPDGELTGTLTTGVPERGSGDS